MSTKQTAKKRPSYYTLFNICLLKSEIGSFFDQNV